MRVVAACVPVSLVNNFRIALRNLLRYRRRSLLTIAAVAMGVFCLIVFQALLAGLDRKMMESALGLDTGIIQIHAAGFVRNQTRLVPLPESDSLPPILQAAGLPRYSMRLKAPALILAGKHSSSVQLSGIDPDREAAVSLIRQKMLAGNYRLAAGRILISKGLAEALGIGLGDSLTLMAQSLYGQARTARFTVGGIFATGLDSFDQSHVYLPLHSAQILLEAEGLISEAVLSCPPERANELAARLRQSLPGSRYRVLVWPELVPDLAQLMELNQATFRLLVLILFAMVAMGIVNTMTTVVFERFREFGTLAALGASPARIIGLVLSESLLLGFFAALVGSLIALVACLYLGRFGIDLAHFTSANQYFVAGSVLRPVLVPSDFAFANILALGTAGLAGLYPAWKAATLNPVEALRHV